MRKTAFLTILAAAALFVAGCTDDPNTGRPDDGTTEEPGTENPDTDEPGTEDNTDRISLITFRNDEGYEHYWAFTYDSQDRPVAVDFNGTEEDDTFFYHYQINYSDNHVRFYDDTISIDLTLDASGRAVSGIYHEAYDEYGYSEEYETEISFTYDSEGRLIKETGTEDGYDEYMVEYTWENGNMVNSYIDYYDAPFQYSEYANKSNIDINWILTTGYGSQVGGAVGFLGVLGERSADYVFPTYFDDDMAEANQPAEEWICEDLIGITRTREYSRHVVAYDESVAEYTFNDTEQLTDITKTVPNYMVHYSQDYTITVVNPDGYVLRDGKKYYHYEAVRYEYEEPVETGREPMDPDITYVSITY